MTYRNSPTFTFIADYLATPLLILLIIGYCGLIFISRSFLGVFPTVIMIGLGVFGLFLLGRGIVASRNRNMKTSDRRNSNKSNN